MILFSVEWDILEKYDEKGAAESIKVCTVYEVLFGP
jgi:hypothetical protein